MIQFNNVKKEYIDNDFVLGDLTFQVDDGEFVFVIGPSGSGKTSLIKLLIREETPSDGKIFFDEYDITQLTRDSIYKLRRYIGVIFQDYKLIPDKTVSENVAFAMEVAGRSSREIRETVPYLLEIVGLTHRAEAFPEYLSGGEKQRVAIARAVSNNPKVLIADEPTGNLDPAAAWDIVQILSKINNWGTTVIMSTHGTDIVNTLNKRVIQMHDGKIVRDDNKGMYEVGKIDPNKQPSQATIDKARLDTSQPQGPIRVRIKSGSEVTDAEMRKGRRGLLSWMWPFRATLEDESLTTPLEDEFGQVVDSEIAKQEFITEVDKALEQESEQEVKQVLEDADNTSVDKLDLRPEIIADLRTAGYNDVEDLISAGPEKLADELVIDPEEIVLVSRAISEFLKQEDQEFKQKSRALMQPKTKSSNKTSKKDPEPKSDQPTEANAQNIEPKDKVAQSNQHKETKKDSKKTNKESVKAGKPETPDDQKASDTLDDDTEKESKPKVKTKNALTKSKSNVRLDLTGNK